MLANQYREVDPTLTYLRFQYVPAKGCLRIRLFTDSNRSRARPLENCSSTGSERAFWMPRCRFTPRKNFFVSGT